MLPRKYRFEIHGNARLRGASPFLPFLWTLCAALLPLAAQALPTRVEAPLQTLRATPLYFEPNLGQTDSEVRYLARGQGYSFFLTPEAAVWRLHRRLPHLDPVRDPIRKGKDTANIGPDPVLRLRLGQGQGQGRGQIQALEPLPQVSHYYFGRDPRRWLQQVPAFGRVRYAQVYPGIDVEFYGKGPLLEYDFVVSPGADPAAIVLAFEGAQSLRLSQEGDLLVEAGGLVLRHHRPVAHQPLPDGGRREVAADFVLLDARRAGFRLAAFDPDLPLVIDPVVSFATYLGGSGDDRIQAVAVDDTGAIYVTGRTTSLDFPDSDSSALSGSDDLFVSKFSATGELVYSTYLGGGDFFVGERDGGRGIAVDAQGRAYVTGRLGPNSTDFPVTPDAFNDVHNGSYDAFVVRLGENGQLEYASYLGGDNNDVGNAIAVDENGLVYVAGGTRSLPNDSTFPVTSDAAFPDHGGSLDAFLVLLDLSRPGAGALRYGTFFGGVGGEEALALALAGNGVAYIGGTTNTANEGLATAGAYQTEWVGEDGFIARIDTTVSGPGGLTATYVNGPAEGFTDQERARQRAMEIRVTGLAAAGSYVYAVGDTERPSFPLSADAFDQDFAGGREAFVLVLSSDLSTLRFASLFGGGGDEEASGIALDGSGQVYFTGYTTSPDLPGSGANALNFPYRGQRDAYVVKLGSDLDLRFSFYLGGSENDEGLAIAADAGGNVYVGGMTASQEFQDYVTNAPAGLSAWQGGEALYLLAVMAGLWRLSRRIYAGGLTVC